MSISAGPRNPAVEYGGNRGIISSADKSAAVKETEQTDRKLPRRKLLVFSARERFQIFCYVF